MTHGISDQLLAQCSEFVTARLGLHFPRKRWRDLEQRVGGACRDFGFDDPTSCLRWLVTAQLTRDQLHMLAGRLTIGETYFFREERSFEALETHIIPEILAARRGTVKRLRIWCAGCSTGEEPYSIAILLHRMIADLPQWNVTILATDINPASLRKGVQGEYGEWSFRGTPRWVRERYFTKNREGRFEIVAPIRKMVTFAPLNLAEDPYPSLSNNTNAMDVIFCRNVLMYFAPEHARRVVEKLHHSLVPDGWLAVSPCETTHGNFQDFEAVHFSNAFFYRKNGNRRSLTTPPLEPFAGTAPPSPPLAALQQVVPPFPASSRPVPPVSIPIPAPEAARPRLSPYDEALALYRQGLYEDAATKLSGMLAEGDGADRSSFYGEAATLMARLHANRGDFPAALAWAGKAVAVNKLDPELRYLQAVIHQEQGELDAATAALKKTLYLDQTFVLAHFALAILSRQRGRIKDAEKHLDNARSLLDGCGDDDILPGSEGMSARRLREIIASTSWNGTVNR
ncbi:MAG TPA: CheR family methyltransferase [Geobacteraceae bacterium]